MEENQICVSADRFFLNLPFLLTKSFCKESESVRISYISHSTVISENKEVSEMKILDLY